MISFLDLPGFRKLLTNEPSFGSALAAIADGLGLNPSLIANIMSLESAFDPKAQNPSGATGLIQWMPNTAKQLGTTVEMLKSMTGVQQLEYVRRFFAPFTHGIRPNEPGDYYMAIFMPAYLGAPRDTVLGQKGSTELLPKTSLTKGKIYDQNQGLDVNHDGVITVGDVMAKAEQRAASAASKPRLEVAEVPLAPTPVSPPARVSAPPPPSLPPAWRSSGGPCDLPVLRIGARGTAVALAQLLVGSDVITGVYTDALALDIREFQAKHHLKPDAVIGPQTWAALGDPK